MKKIIIAFVAGCIPALAAMNSVNAQNFSDSSIPKEGIAFNKVLVPGNDKAYGPSVINTKAMKHFSQAYKNVSGVTWVKTDDGVAAAFTLKGVSNKVYYNDKGRWTGSLKSYAEDKLPFEVRDMVKRAYYDFAISYANEIETVRSGGVPTYIIHIESKDNYKFIRVCNGEMDVWKELEKQKP